MEFPGGAMVGPGGFGRPWRLRARPAGLALLLAWAVVTRQIAFQRADILSLTISFGGDGLSMGRTGEFVLGADALAGERPTLHLDVDFPWQSRMTGRKPALQRADRPE